jgi:hypothetical protein
MQQLCDLTAPARRLALVGLAKNTGKTEALAALLRELRERGRPVGVTSVGRDGEERDVIDIRIEKPRVELCAGSLVATTDALLRAAALPHELLLETGVRTPLGRVVIARLAAAGTIEVAGPSAAADVRAVADAMLAHGASQVLIDGAIDRRAASSPAVSDGLVMSTGAALHEEIDEVVARTREAVELVRLPEVDTPHVRELAATGASMLIGPPGEEQLTLHPRFALTSTAADLAQLLRARPGASHLLVQGALCEPFLAELLRALDAAPLVPPTPTAPPAPLAHPQSQPTRELQVVVADATRVFLTEHGVGWYGSQGLRVAVLAPIDLRALTVNPVAPHSHSFDSPRLRALLEEAIPDMPVLDVRDSSPHLVPAA